MTETKLDKCRKAINRLFAKQNEGKGISELEGNLIDILDSLDDALNWEDEAEFPAKLLIGFNQLEQSKLKYAFSFYKFIVNKEKIETLNCGSITLADRIFNMEHYAREMKKYALEIMDSEDSVEY